MPKIWSELPGQRLREQLADITTLGWVVVWSSVVWQLFSFLARFAEAGRAVRGGGESMIEGGRDVGASLAGLPLVGSQARDVTQEAFARIGRPLSAFGSELEQFILIVAAVLALLLAAVTLAPWLARYLPWRIARLRRVRAAHRAIRTTPNLPATDVQRVLAMRAVAQLDYATLLDFTPDPLGDWSSGRFDRLANAELASVGLRP